MKNLLSIFIFFSFMSVASAEILICDFENNGDGWSDGDRMILEREDNKFMEVGFPEEDGYHIDFEDEEYVPEDHEQFSEQDFEDDFEKGNQFDDLLLAPTCAISYSEYVDPTSEKTVTIAVLSTEDVDGNLCHIALDYAVLQELCIELRDASDFIIETRGE